MTHPTTRLDPAIHQPARLGILTATCEAAQIDFVALRDLLGLTDGNLSRHLTTLEAAGYIKLEKVFENRKPRTWITATASGRRALRAEIDALREIVASADTASASTKRKAGTRLALP